MGIVRQGRFMSADPVAAQFHHETQRRIQSRRLDDRRGSGLEAMRRVVIGDGIRSDLIRFSVDRNPFKHGKFLPGTHIPIRPVEELEAAQPDYVLIMPWNLREEISAQLAGIRVWGGRLVVALPRLEVF